MTISLVWLFCSLSPKGSWNGRNVSQDKSMLDSTIHMNVSLPYGGQMRTGERTSFVRSLIRMSLYFITRVFFVFCLSRDAWNSSKRHGQNLARWIHIVMMYKRWPDKKTGQFERLAYSYIINNIYIYIYTFCIINNIHIYLYIIHNLYISI